MLRSNYHHPSHLKINFLVLSHKENYQNTVVFLEDDCVSCNKLVIWFLFPELGLLPTFNSHTTCTIILPDLNKIEWEEKVEFFFGKFREYDSSSINGMDIQLKLEESATDPDPFLINGTEPFYDEAQNLVKENQSSREKPPEKKRRGRPPKAAAAAKVRDESRIVFKEEDVEEDTREDPLYDEDHNMIHTAVEITDLNSTAGGQVINGNDDAYNTKAIRGHFGNIIPIVKNVVYNELNEDLRVVTSHEQVLKECEICQQISRKRGGIFKRHVLSDHPYLAFFACDACEFIAFTNLKLKTHFQRIHVETTLTACPKCGLKRKNLRNHIKHCTGESKTEESIKSGNYEDFIQAIEFDFE